MALASRIDFQQAFEKSTTSLLLLGIGAIGALIAALSSIYGPIVGYGASVLIPLATVVVLRPRIGILLFIFALAFIEEYAGGLSDQEVARSARQPFYSITLGLPAFYVPDAILSGLLLLFLVRKLLWREGYRFVLDKIGGALLMLAATMAISILLGLWGDEPFGPPVLDLSLLGAIKLPEAAARYIAVLQLKLFALIFPAYVLGLIYFREPRDIRDMTVAFGIGMAGTIGLGAWRVFNDPSMVTKLIAVIYDTGTVTMMALAVFYMISKWACRLYTPQQAMLRAAFSIALMLLILVSFRRTLWGAIALCAVILPFIMPSSGRKRFFMLIAVAAGLGAVAMAVLPGGQQLMASVIARGEETNLNDASTLYRFSLLVWMVDRFGELPLFGWGLKPLWNETIHIRFFTSNMENVHSLYFWILVRFGAVGLFVAGLGLALVLLRMVQVWRMVPEEEYRILLSVIFISIVIYLFGGIFNPVYANVRLLVPMGFALALVSRLPEIAAAGRLQAKA